MELPDLRKSAIWQDRAFYPERSWAIARAQIQHCLGPSISEISKDKIAKFEGYPKNSPFPIKIALLL